MNGNEFDGHEARETREAEFARILADVPYSNGHWNESIEAAIEAAGAHCTIDGLRITITDSDGDAFLFFKEGQVILSETDRDLNRYVDLGQSAVSEVMAEEFKGRLMFEQSTKTWYAFTDCWHPDLKGRARYLIKRRIDAIRDTVPENNQPNKRLRKEMASSGYASGVRSFLQDHPSISAHISDFDQDPYLVGCPGGYIDLRTGKMHEPDPKKLITMQVATAPDEKAECPRWIEFLEQAHDGQEDAIAWLQKLAGEALIGKNTAAHFAFFFGTGGNGKSVFTGVLLNVISGYGSVAQSGTFTMPAGRAGYRGHAQVLAVLRGKRLVVASEPDENEQWDMGRVKEWTGGNEIRANLMYENSQKFLPQGLLIMEANTEISVSKVDNAVARRLRMLIWPQKFSGDGYWHLEKRELKDEIFEAEAPAILQWMIEGAQKVIEEGLGFCGPVQTASASYLREQDETARFIEDCFIEMKGNQPGVDLQDATAIQNIWADREEVKKVKYLGKLLKDKGMVVTKTGSRRYVRDTGLSDEGMELMDTVLRRRLVNRELDRETYERWYDKVNAMAKGDDERHYLRLLMTT